MTTLESASKRLERALQTLEAKIAQDRQAPPPAASGEDAAAIDSLRRQYADLNSEYEALVERYDSLLEKNLSLSDRLDGVITRLKETGDVRRDMI